MSSRLGRHAPSLDRFLSKRVGPAYRALFVLTASLVLTAAAVGVRLPATPLAWVFIALTMAQVALFLWAIAALVRFFTARRLDASAYPLAAAVFATYLVLDHLAFGILREHPTLGIARETLEALRAGAIHATLGGAATFAAGVALAWLLLVLGLKALAHLPDLPRIDAGLRTAAIPGLLVVGAGASLGACLFHDAPSVEGFERAIPWAPQPGDHASRARNADAKDRVAILFGHGRVWDELQRRRASVLAHPPRAKTRPDVLIVHVESLRADMLRSDVAPSMTALAKECLVPRHHLTTGTNTGTAVFGILDGLSAPYYPLARRAHAPPLPLQVLKALGYRVSVYFANNFRVYDGLYDLFFAGIADATYEGPTEPVFAADAQMVDAYVAKLRSARDDAPRFDYVVLDSSHYDYSYPPAFEEFTPAQTLELGIRDGVVFREGINEELKPRAASVKNRYQNSVLYADSLVQRIVDALRATGRLDRTILVVTGDHGEEFWEHGVFGHGYGYLSQQQREVPLLVRIPGGATTTRYRYTSHADIFPTIFDVMGLETAELGFMNGKSLLRYEPALDFAVVGFGVTGEQADHRLVVLGDGLAVHWYDAPPFAVTEVTADDDSPSKQSDGTQADDLVFRAVAGQGLH